MMRVFVCFLVVAWAVGCAATQPHMPTLSGVRPSLALLEARGGASAFALAAAPGAGSEVVVRINFADARNRGVRSAAPSGLAGLALVRAFQGQGAEWQRHYGLGVSAASVAYAMDSHDGADRAWRAFAAGLIVGAAKEISDDHFDRRDFEATACGAAITALMQGIMPRWEW